MRLIHATCIAVLGLSACSAANEPTPVEPLPDAVEIPVSLVRTSGIPRDGLPRLEVTGVSQGVEVRWEVVGAPCMLAKATAKLAGSVVQIEIEQSGDPLASCVAGPVGYRFVARATGLSPRQYEVRVVDATLGLVPVQIGRQSAAALP